jgi:protein involved in polysaccharide export with SLBB domain
VKPAGKKAGIPIVWLGVGLCFSLLSGCASSSSQNRQVYDRYAELIAERSRAPQSTATAKDSAKPLDRRPLKAAPIAKPVPPAGPAEAMAKTVSVVNPAPAAAAAPAAAKPASLTPPPPAVQPAPAPVQAPPVQIIAPKPVPAPAPQPLEAPKPAAAVEPAASLPAPVPAPAPTVAPAGAVPPPAGASGGDSGAYTLKVGDGVQVYLRGIPMSDAIEDLIDERGKITLPLINEIQAAGITASQLEQSIRQTYLDQDIYRNITVNVVVPTRFYFIQGEIRQPGRFQIVSATRVSQAIAGAGGYTEYASGQVVVKRGGKIFKTIKNSRRLERTPDDDILLEPDDIIEVRRSLW